MSILICQPSGLNWPNGSVPRHMIPAMAGQEVERTCRVASSFTSWHRCGRSASHWCHTGGSLSRPPRQGRQGGPRDPALPDRLHHIGVGRAHIGKPVLLLLVANKHIWIVREDGSLLRELTLGPTCDYRPLGTSSGRRALEFTRFAWINH